MTQSSVRRRNRFDAACLILPFLTALLGVAALVVLGSVGWPGDVGADGTGFCEAVRPGPVAQPVNTWSNAGFLIAGVAIGWQAWRDVGRQKATGWDNRLVTTVVYPASYATSVVAIGLASAAMHASMTPWAAELDLLSMHLWGAWCLAFSTTRLLRVGDRTFTLIFTLVTATLLARIALAHPLNLKGATLFGAMIVVAIGIELVGLVRNRRRQRIDTQYLAWGIGTFLVAYAANLLGRPSGTYCDPYSLWQGHAVWHVLCCGSSTFVYLYGRSERTRAAC